MPKINTDRYNIVALHTAGENACNNVAFYYQGPIISWGETVESKRAIFSSGQKPNPTSFIRCGTCGMVFNKGQFLNSISLWVSEKEYNAKT